MNQEKLGKYLVSLRKEKGLTQKDVAKQIGVTEQAVSKWERGIGTPDIGLWNNICEVFKIEPIELFQGGNFQTNTQKNNESQNETKKVEEYNDMLKQTIEISNTEINKMKLKETILLTILSIGIYIVSLIIQNYIINSILFIVASIITIYLLGYVLRKKNYSIKFFISIGILTLIILSYSFLEKISIMNQFREPIFSIKEIYKEYQITLYHTLFFKAYSCDSAQGEISLLNNREIDTVCNQEKNYNSETEIVLKSGAIITQEQKEVLDSFKYELLKKGYIDYNYMRQADLNRFMQYMDDNVYCGTYDSSLDDSIMVKRKNGICQYNDDNYYYCKIEKSNGTIEYKKAKNKQCNGK